MFEKNRRIDNGFLKSFCCFPSFLKIEKCFNSKESCHENNNKSDNAESHTISLREEGQNHWSGLDKSGISFFDLVVV